MLWNQNICKFVIQTFFLFLTALLKNGHKLEVIHVREHSFRCTSLTYLTTAAKQIY